MHNYIPFVLIPFIGWGVRRHLVSRDDCVIADTIGNSFGTVTAVFMILTMSGRGSRWDWRLVAMVLLGLLAYETLNLFNQHPFDLNDVLAAIVFGGLSAVLYAAILNRHGD